MFDQTTESKLEAAFPLMVSGSQRCYLPLLLWGTLMWSSHPSLRVMEDRPLRKLFPAACILGPVLSLAALG